MLNVFTIQLAHMFFIWKVCIGCNCPRTSMPAHDHYIKFRNNMTWIKFWNLCTIITNELTTYIYCVSDALSLRQNKTSTAIDSLWATDGGMQCFYFPLSLSLSLSRQIHQVWVLNVCLITVRICSWVINLLSFNKTIRPRCSLLY